MTWDWGENRVCLVLASVERPPNYVLEEGAEFGLGKSSCLSSNPLDLVIKKTLLGMTAKYDACPHAQSTTKGVDRPRKPPFGPGP